MKVHPLSGVFPVLAFLGTAVFVGQDLLSKFAAESRTNTVARYFPVQPRQDTSLGPKMKTPPRVLLKTIEAKIDAIRDGAIETRGGYLRVYIHIFLPELIKLAEEHPELLLADLPTASDAGAAYLLVALTKSGHHIDKSVISQLKAREGDGDENMALKTEIDVYLHDSKKK